MLTLSYVTGRCVELIPRVTVTGVCRIDRNGTVWASAGYQPRLVLYGTVWLEGGSGMVQPYSMMSIIQALQAQNFRGIIPIVHV